MTIDDEKPFRLHNDELLARMAKYKQVATQRLSEVLSREKVELSKGEVEAIVSIVSDAEAGYNRNAAHEQLNKAHKEYEQRHVAASKALPEILAKLEKAVELLMPDVVDHLASKGISCDEANNVLNALQEFARLSAD